MWSIFDTQTIVVMFTLLFVMCTGVIALLLLSRRPAVGAGEWGLLLLLYVLSSLMLQLRRPGWDIAPLPFLVFFGCLPSVFLWHGLRRWRGLPDLSWPLFLAGPLIGAGLTILALNVSISPIMRSGISPLVTGTIAALSLACAWPIPGFRAVRIAIGCFIAMQVLRVGLHLGETSIEVRSMSTLVQSMIITATGVTLYQAVCARAAASTGVRSTAS